MKSMIDRFTRPHAMALLIGAVLGSTVSAGMAASSAQVSGRVDPASPAEAISGVEPLGVVPEWIENFDTYASGSQIHGQGGWKGWGNAASAGALVSSAQSTSAPNAIAIVGATDLVREFSGYTDGVYVMSARQFVPTGFSGESYFIVQNRYQDAMTDLSWSTQVVFDSADSVVKNFDDPTFGGANPGSQPLVTGQWSDLLLVIDLDSDRQAFYYNGAVVFSGSWTAQYPVNPPNTAGTLTIGAIDLFANNASVVYYDDIAIRPDRIFSNGFEAGDLP
ncbi:MAG: hypothetical protein J0L88_03835 [Xanthomonadales bacterium]|nr:hypothetical protein [Xanthomonadales bacterium]